MVTRIGSALVSSQARRFDELVRPHVPSLYRFAFRLLGDHHDAEDLVQEVLTKLYPRTGEMAQLRELRPWLHRVLYNQFVDDTRRQRRRLEDADEDALASAAEDTVAGPMEQSARGESVIALERALGELSEEQRALVALHLIEGHTLEELTRVLELPLGTLKSRLHRTKARLKALLEVEPFAPAERDRSESRAPGSANGGWNGS